ncbi:MAG: chorismate mutase [Erysipelotrichaceae bacterium]|nr:chorismate mutase [Erysipelotrichaceae bacterium]
MKQLEEVRKEIDSIDRQIQELLMKRLDCSYQVAQFKKASGDRTIYRADREQAILDQLGKAVDPDRRKEYLAVIRKIMETSRMYQYGLLYDWNDDLFSPLVQHLTLPAMSKRIRLILTRKNQPNAMSSILSMIGDYGYNMDRMHLLEDNKQNNIVTFELIVLGNIQETNMRKLMVQLSMESMNFQMIECE